MIKNPQKTKEKIREHYRGLRPREFILPPKSNWRQFKVRYILESGGIRWIKIRDRINSRKKLKEQLVKFAPLDVYCTISYWLNPSILGKKDSELYKNIFLGSDFLVDIDVPFVDGGREQTKQVKELVEEEGYQVNRVVFSGSGSHLHLYDFYEIESGEVRKREENCREKMKGLADKLNEFEIDYEISVDPRRVRKVPRTITSYGTITEIIGNINSFEPKQLFEIKYKNKTKLVDW